MSNHSSKPKKIPERGYYFWRYDGFPGLLGGEGRLRATGFAEIPSYGNATFRPVLAFRSVKKGKAFHTKLTELRRQYEHARHMLYKGADEQRRALEASVKENVVPYQW